LMAKAERATCQSVLVRTKKLCCRNKHTQISVMQESASCTPRSGCAPGQLSPRGTGTDHSCLEPGHLEHMVSKVVKVRKRGSEDRWKLLQLYSNAKIRVLNHPSRMRAGQGQCANQTSPSSFSLNVSAYFGVTAREFWNQN
jgi:hypothetical protein